MIELDIDTYLPRGELLYQINISVRPESWKRTSNYNGKRLKTKGMRDYQKLIMDTFLYTWKHEPIQSPISVLLIFQYQAPSNTAMLYPMGMDVDNLAKAIFDAGNMILWKDDRFIVSTQLHKRFGPEDMVHVSVYEA